MIAYGKAATIRKARSGDRSALNNVMRRASLAVESGAVLSRLLAEPEHLQIDEAFIEGDQVVLAEAGGKVVGFASFVVAGSNQAELDGMFVDPGYWRRGIGRLLFTAVELELNVRQATTIRVVAGDSAVPFYLSVGFSIVGQEKTPLGPVVPVMTKLVSTTASLALEKPA